jgi:hypothetical protein
MERIVIDIAIRHFEASGLPPGPVSVQTLAGDGSSRLFFRASREGCDKSVIIMCNPPANETLRRENFAYLMIARHLHSKGIPVPEIHRWDLEEGWFLMADLGTLSLQEAVAGAKDPLPLYVRSLQALIKLQTEGIQGFDPAWCWQTERYDLHVMRRLESDYFRDMFLSRFVGLKSHWPELEGPFDAVAAAASKGGTGFLMHRDFQSRNIMVSGERLGFVDWQGCRLGPLGYDLASLLIDPYTGIPRTLRTRLYEIYRGLLMDHAHRETASFEESFPYLAIQRNLQILGAFSFLSRVRGKTRFEAYIPPSVETLLEGLRTLDDPVLRPLEEVVLQARDLLNAPRLADI